MRPIPWGLHIAYDKGNFEFRERLKIQLVREFGAASSDHINATVEKLTRQGKL